MRWSTPGIRSVAQSKAGRPCRMIPSAKMIAERRTTRVSVPGPLEPRTEGEGHRDADDEDEEREHHVGRGPAVPGGVAKRRIDGGPGARVVDEHHSGDREAPQRVERDETGLTGRRAGSG